MKKANLPKKICPVCNKSFTWRKKMEDPTGKMSNTVQKNVEELRLKNINGEAE